MSDIVNEDLGFDPTLKKKKKKVKTVEENETLETTPKVDDIDDMFSGLKKKKKKSSSKDESSPLPVLLLDDEEDLADSLGKLKLKKKKKKSALPTVVDDFEKQLEKAGVLEDDDTNVGNDSFKESTPDLATTGSIQGSTPGLAYTDLLLRFFKILKENNPELAGERSGSKFRIPPPVVQREGAKRTMFANVQDIAQVLQRSPEHLIQYLFAELGTSGSIDGQKRLIIKGRFQPKQIESILRKYVIEYVTCKTCKSMNTELKRESANRLHFIVCKACGSTRSVSSIKTGFQAHVGRRKKMA